MRKLGLLCMASTLIWLVACGVNSAKSPSSFFGTSGTVSSIMVSCSPPAITTVTQSESQCSATVSGTGNFSQTVIWSANNGATVSQSGLLSFNGIVPPVTITVTATSNQNLNVLGTATVVVNPPVVPVAVSCLPMTIMPGGTSQCSAIVTGYGSFNSDVTWSANMGAQVTVTPSDTALITFTQMITSPVTVTVTATSVVNPAASGTATVTVNPMSATNNVAPIIVDGGPDPQNFIFANVAYVTVTVCVPGTNTCQTIDHVLVDTGSSGLRLLSSDSGGEFNLPLPQETISGNPVDECALFADGYTWGPTATADITVAGESGSSVPVQVIIPPTDSPAVPSTCSNQSTSGNLGQSLDTLAANGILGVGLFQNDCGQYCVQLGDQCDGMSLPCIYYQCPQSGCVGTNISIAQQVPNPATVFPDNNGVLIQLPAVPDGGSPDVAGVLIFGIGTQSNNSLSLAANVYPVPDDNSSAGDIITMFNEQSYPGFLDSGSGALFFLDSTTTGIPTCQDPLTALYCPNPSPDNLTVSNQGQNNSGPVGMPIPANFSVEDATTLFGTNNAAFSTLGGEFPEVFDFGLPFFYGRNVFTAIDGASTPGGTGPFFAY